MKVHTLKCEPPFFSAIRTGEKTFEIRKNDRCFEVGDHLVLTEVVPSDINPGWRYSGRSLMKTILYMTDFAQQDGYVVMSLGEIQQ
jgi:hypothetical protein